MKIKSAQEIGEIARDLKRQGKIVVTTNGSFDLLHSAHINLLEKAKQEGDVLIFLVNSDSSIKRAKGDKRPVIPENERMRMLAGLEAVDYVVLFNEDTPLKLLELIKPNKHIKGGSFIQNRISEEKSLIERYGGEHKTLSLEEGFSTTNIIERILEVYKKD